MPLATPVQHVHAHAAQVSVDQQVISLFNAIRRRYGLRPLRQNSRLRYVAAMHSIDMARHHLLSHSSSNGTSFDSRVRHVIHARMIGETIAEVGGSAGARTVFRGWMHSYEHRTVIMAPGFRSVGVGWARRGRVKLFTADFASGR